MSGSETTENQLDLIARCATFVEAGAEAISWINTDENAESVGVKKDTLERTLRRSMRRAGKLRDASATNMAVSVFGPSQNGKSFLVSVLAQPEGKPLTSAFNDPNGALSYIEEINPAGEGESTGLVTRFTMKRGATPDGYPILLEMLSAGDLIQLLANAFFMDGDNTEDAPSAEMMEAHLATFTARAQPGSGSGALTADDIWEVADYIERNFKTIVYAKELKAFWEGAARIAPNLPLAQLGPFFAPVWGDYAELNEVFLKLVGGLAKIGFARSVHARMDALVPRSTSIIDVAQLYLLAGADTATLDLSLSDGRTATLERSVVSALTAEFTLPMQDLPDEMFEEVDLLDFPGARNRFSKPLSAVIKDTENGGIGRLILRGKVAYLFDRYVEDQKINAMLLCIKDSNMDTTDLPPLIENWISLTQGSTPEMRAKSACILFFCLTFFDKHLVDSAAGAEDSFRFFKRVDESLVKAFGSDGWVTEWAPGRAFDNSFWIRNPNYPAEPFFKYDKKPWKEHANPEKAGRIDELKEACLSVPLVQTHFADPTRAWDTAMSAGDGGVSYLKDSLRKVCHVQQKIDQISVQIASLETLVDSELRSMYISDDFDERLAEKRESAGNVLDGLITALERRTFAELMARMMVDFDEVVDRMSQVPSNIRISSAKAPPKSGTGARMVLPGGRKAPVRTEDMAGDGIETMSRAEFQTQVVIKSWVERLEALKRDRSLEKRYGLDNDAMSDLAGELISASRRHDLHAKTRAALEAVQFGLTLEGQARPAALVACELVNRFVSTFGLDDVPMNKRPTIDVDALDGQSESVPVFCQVPVRASVEDLPETPRSTLEETFQHWAFALDHGFTQNASFVAGGQVNDKQNRALGAILRKLQNATEAAG